MTSSPAESSPETVAAAIERNPAEYWRAWCSYCPGAVFEENKGFTRFITGAPFAPCNQVVLSDLAAEETQAQVTEILAPFRDRSLPMLWSVSPSVRPRDLGDVLQACGLAANEPMAGMAIELNGLPDASAVPGLTVERVAGVDGLDLWGRLYHGGFGLPDGFADTFVATFKRAGVDGPFRHYVGLLQGEPVACSTMSLGAGACPERSRRVAGLWHITTLPHVRGRGIGGEMTLAPLRDARAAGYRLGTLYAAPMGKSVYLRLGFREYHTLQQYMWLGDGSHS